MSRPAWKRMNRLGNPKRCEKDLLTHCTFPERSGHPGPQHDPKCPVYATHKVELFRCDGVGIDHIPTKIHHHKSVVGGPVKLVIVEIGS